MTPQNGPTRQLTIADIFAEGGLTGRAPETVKWSPDGKRVSYVLRDDSGEHGQLWYIDLEATRPAVLVTSEKLCLYLHHIIYIRKYVPQLKWVVPPGRSRVPGFRAYHT